LTPNHDRRDGARSAGRIVVNVPAGLPRPLVAGYLARARDGLTALRDVLDRHDYDGARVLGHRMKGSGRAYGFGELTDAGARIEQAAARGDGAALEEAIVGVESYLGRVELAGA